ncbi:MAG: FAD:protein FMN transferase [Planctomycetia bacterium]|nr:FAD:protein FMN transferase [Planctomycetia bacterium]
MPAEYIHISREVMASTFQVFLNAGEYKNGVDIALDALDEVSRLEKLLNYFDSQSEINRVNVCGAKDFVQIVPEVYGLLKKCDKIYKETEGAFDITSSPLWEAWGFSRRKPRFPEESVWEEARKCVGADAILWDDAQNALKFQKKGMKISLGSIGKGFALDAAVSILDASGVNNYLFHGGLSSVFARGKRRGRKDWQVGLHHPLKINARIMEISLRDGALATSGSATQFFWYQGKRYGHILDPRTGNPVQGVLSATVLAQNATDADALATAFYVMGVEKTEEYCKKNPELGVIFVLPGEGENLEIKKIGSVP